MKLYVILGSHPCRTGMLLLEHKRLDYQLVRLPTALQPVLLPLLGFRSRSGRSTVPALEVDGRRVMTNRAIARFLDELRPEPPLFPPDAERRALVEEAERWGDEVFQMAARRLVIAAALRGAISEEGRLGPLLWRRRGTKAAGVRVVARFFAVDAAAEARLRAKLPAMLDRIDGWIEAGVLNGRDCYAADYMIVSSLALLCYGRDLEPEIARRPAMRLVERLLP